MYCEAYKDVEGTGAGCGKSMYAVGHARLPALPVCAQRITCVSSTQGERI